MQIPQIIVWFVKSIFPKKYKIMAKQYVDLDTLKFLLYDVHDLNSVLEQERYADHDQESIEIFINSVKDFSDKELFPYFKEMDEVV